MDFYKKRRIKDYFKKNKYALIGTGIFLLSGLVVLLVGCALSGWNLIAWLHSRWAISFFIMVIIGLSLLALMYVLWKRFKKLY